MLQDRLADVVAVEPVALAGVGGRESGAVLPLEQSLEQGRGFSTGIVGAETGAC